MLINRLFEMLEDPAVDDVRSISLTFALSEPCKPRVQIAKGNVTRGGGGVGAELFVSGATFVMRVEEV
jgi:hypothetical protein